VPRGQWCEGGDLKGTPHSRGPEASFQLSRLYSPTFTFGDVAREYVASRDDIDRYRNFVNSWLGEVWVPRQSHAEWNEIGQKLMGNYDRGRIPANCTFLTAAVDVQIDHWVWVILGWTSLQQGSLVEYGHAMSWDDLLAEIRRPRRWTDDGQAVPQLTLVDARDGNRTDEVIEFCRSANSPSGPWIWACMGTDGVHGGMGQRPFLRQKLTQTGRQRHSTAALEEVECVKVNTGYYQNWIQNCLERRVPNHPNSLGIPRGSEDDEDLLRQLLNEVPEYRQDTTGHDRVQWARVTRSVPVDYRDAIRYARCAADVYLNNNWARVVARKAVAVSAAAPAISGKSVTHTKEVAVGGVPARKEFLGSGRKRWINASAAGWLSR
jgi:phage terminase large subunit GpA-like protein